MTEARSVQLPRAAVGALVGVAGVAVIALGVDMSRAPVDRTVPAVLLLLPVLACGFVAGWRTSVGVALVAGFAYCFAFLPPIDAFRFGFTTDVLVLSAFVVVAVAVSFASDRWRARRVARDRNRSMMFRSVSHDLRNPLGVIRGASEELKGGAVTDARAREALLDLIVDESDRLERIVANMLSLSRIEAGALTPDLQAESVEAVLRAGIDRLDRLVEGRRVELQVDGGLGPVLIDRTQIDQVVANLVENALRHTDSDPVVVQATDQGRCVEVAVIDRGPGFPPGSREHLFGVFRPLGPTGSDGLGLAVSQAIVRAHGGTISVDDEPAGGARVSFALPKA